VLDLRSYMKSARHSVLCIGPMSKNAVDAVISYANSVKAPIPLIASRRQVESEHCGGGYVNSWNSRTFAQYVASKDRGYVHICRDHGGPWQGEGEKDLSQEDAMQRAKAALLDDIVNGFDIVHLDPSLKSKELTDQKTMNMLFELYTCVCETARQLGRRVEIEVGTEQQSGRYSDPQELVAFLKAITNFCEKMNYQRPLFCVVQTGTLVKEMRNVGFTEGRKNESFDQKYAVDTMEKTLRYLVDIACINGVFVKEHNGDYLSDGSMSLRRRLDLGAVNVAPELGVFESKSLVRVCRELGLQKQLEAMLGIFYASQKWVKWLSAESQATDLERAVMAGHYTFGKPEFLAVKAEIGAAANKKGIDLDQFICDGLMSQLQRMSWNLGYFHNVASSVWEMKGLQALAATDEPKKSFAEEAASAGAAPPSAGR
jgi:hypothetical protein